MKRGLALAAAAALAARFAAGAEPEGEGAREQRLLRVDREFSDAAQRIGSRLAGSIGKGWRAVHPELTSNSQGTQAQPRLELRLSSAAAICLSPARIVLNGGSGTNAG